MQNEAAPTIDDVEKLIQKQRSWVGTIKGICDRFQNTGEIFVSQANVDLVVQEIISHLNLPSSHITVADMAAYKNATFVEFNKDLTRKMIARIGYACDAINAQEGLRQEQGWPDNSLMHAGFKREIDNLRVLYEEAKERDEAYLEEKTDDGLIIMDVDSFGAFLYAKTTVDGPRVKEIRLNEGEEYLDVVSDCRMRCAKNFVDSIALGLVYATKLISLTALSENIGEFGRQSEEWMEEAQPIVEKAISKLDDIAAYVNEVAKMRSEGSDRPNVHVMALMPL